MPIASFFTLGCRLNQTESALMAHSLVEAGYEVTQAKQNADLCVINTCTVTGQSDQKCKKSIRQIQRANPTAFICVVGCMSQMASDEILEIGGVDLILGTEEKMNLAKYVSRMHKGDDPVIAVGPISKGEFSIENTTQHHLGMTRANLKIQDGCDFICSFCIIPQARGRSRSRELQNILQEVESILSQGTKEIILTGVNLGCFESGGLDLLGLVDRLAEYKDLKRLRISSIEPTTMSEVIFDRMTDPSHPLMPYLHLPLQSPNDRILSLMRRRYDLSEYQAFIAKAYAAVPDICIGSDLLTAFPSETEEEFAAGVELLKAMPIHYFHVFPYAKREGTRSVNMEGHVAPQEMARRVEILRELSDEKKRAYSKAYIGQELDVLFEGNDGGTRYSGYSANFIRVQVESTEPLKNQIRAVKIESIEGNIARGTVV